MEIGWFQIYDTIDHVSAEIFFLIARYQKLWCDFRQYMIQEYVFVNAEGKSNKKQIEEADLSFSASASTPIGRSDSFASSSQPPRHD